MNILRCCANYKEGWEQYEYLVYLTSYLCFNSSLEKDISICKREA